jgi:protein-disulfide isomerase
MELRFAFLSLALLLAVATLAPAADLVELRDAQTKILERLDAQDKVLQQILKRLESMPAGGGRPAVDPNRVYELPIAGSAVKGPKDAPVTLVEFSDFQCPFCARSTTFADELVAAYPKDLKLVYKHLPLTQIHPNAMPAAKASVAAQNQGKFWEMHDELFAIYKELTPEKIRGVAEKIGLDLAKFDADLADPKTEARVREDMKLAQDVSVTGTPTFFLNGKRLTTRDVPTVKSLIDEALKKKP